MSGPGYHTLAEAFSGWRDSQPHRANMLKGGVNRLGIAAVYAPQSKYRVWVISVEIRRYQHLLLNPYDRKCSVC